MRITGTKKLLIVILALLCAVAAGLVGVFWNNGSYAEGVEITTPVSEADTPSEGEGGIPVEADALTQGEGITTPVSEADAPSEEEGAILDNEGEEGPEYDPAYDESVLYTLAQELDVAPDTLFYISLYTGKTYAQLAQDYNSAILNDMSAKLYLRAEFMLYLAIYLNKTAEQLAVDYNADILAKLDEGLRIPSETILYLAVYFNKTVTDIQNAFNAQTISELMELTGQSTENLVFYAAYNGKTSADIYKQYLALGDGFNTIIENFIFNDVDEFKEAFCVIRDKVCAFGGDMYSGGYSVYQNVLGGNYGTYDSAKVEAILHYAENQAAPAGSTYDLRAAQNASSYIPLPPDSVSTYIDYSRGSISYYSTCGGFSWTDTHSTTYRSTQNMYPGSTITFGLSLSINVSYVSLSNSSYMTWTSQPSTNGNSGTYRCLLSGVAGPSTYTMSVYGGSYRFYGHCTSGASYYLSMSVVLTRTAPKITMASGTGVNTSTNTKTVAYTGSDQTITFNGDYGPSFISYSTSGGVTLANTRTADGTSGSISFTAKNQGTYSITFSRGSRLNTWTDGTNGSLTFYFVIKPAAPMPELANAPGVDYGTNTKTVQYTLDGNSVAFTNVNSTYVRYSVSSSNVTLGTWSGTNLTLKATEVGTYTITFNLTDAAGSWEDYTTGGKVFKFVITAQKAERPTLVAETGVSGNTKRVNYDGNVQSITLSPASKGSISFSAPGMTQKSWEDGKLVLTASNIQTYVVTVTPINNNVTWTDGTRGAITFSLVIAPELVTIPTLNSAEPGVVGNIKTTTYNGVVQSITISPINKSKVIISATGMEQSLEDGVLTLTATNANTYNIEISLISNDVIWRDNTREKVTFSFIINKKQVTAPTIKKEDNVSGNTKTVTYNPTNGGTYHTITIENIREPELDWDATGMTQHSWDATTLVLRATNAFTYRISISLRDNYEWAAGEAAPTFVLVINRFAIDQPTAIISEEEDKYYDNDDPRTVKTVLYDGSVKSMKVETGTAAQVIIGYSGLTLDWDDKVATFSATNARNYQITVTPGANYTWKVDEGNSEDHSPRYFKLVITPILFNDPVFYYMNESNQFKESIETDISGAKVATVVYVRNGNKYMRIAVNQTDVTYRLINANGQGVDKLDGFYFSSWETDPNMLDSKNNPVKEQLLQFYAMNANTYTIRLTLRNDNYAFNNGETTRDYKFIIAPQPIYAPEVVGSESYNVKENGSYEFLKEGFYGDTYIEGTYNSRAFGMVIKLAKNDQVSVSVTSGMTYDAKRWTEDRIYVEATNAGVHTVSLTISSGNYCWADYDERSYKFDIIIAEHIIADPSFLYESYERDAEGEYKLVNNERVLEDTVLIDGDIHTVIYSRYAEYIVFKPSSYDLGKFIDTPYNEQISYTAVGSRAQMTRAVFDKDMLRLYAVNADSYTITITPTANYMWSDLSKQPLTFVFIISPKVIEMPEIVTSSGYPDEEDETINPGTSTRTVIYNRAYQELILNIYDKYAITVVSALGANANNTAREMKEVNVKTQYSLDENKYIAYSAINADKYTLRIKLSNSINYEWYDPGLASTAYVDNYLDIQKLGIYAPDVLLMDIDAEIGAGDAEKGKEGLTSIDSSNNYTGQFEYDGKQHTVYVVSKDKDKDDLAFTFRATQSGKKNDMKNVPTGIDGIYQITMSQANIYDVTVSFKTPNYFWNDNIDEIDTREEPKVFHIQVDMLGLHKPTIVGEESSEWAGNNLYSDFTFDLDTTWDIHIAGVMLQYDYMNFAVNNVEYTSAELVSETDAAGNRLLHMSTKYPDVTKAYYVTIKLDTYNVFWISEANTSESKDTAAKNIYIRINKAIVSVPTFVDNIDAANALIKNSIYTGEKQEFKIENINSDWVTYSFATPDTMELLSYKITPTTITVGSDKITINKGVLEVRTDAPAVTYTVVIKLKETGNMKWESTGGITDLNFQFVINKVLVEKPSIVTSGDGDGVIGDTKTVIYNYGKHVLQINNYINDLDNRWMSLKVISTSQFDESDFTSTADEDAEGYLAYNGILTYKATNVASYVVRITLSNNAKWSDDSTYVDLTLIIQKLQYATPYIVDDYDENGNPAGTVNGLTRTVTYNLKEQKFVIANYNPDFMDIDSVTGDIEAEGLGNMGTGTNNIYSFKAMYVGTYTVTIKIRNYANTRFEDYATETVKYTFKINILYIDKPVGISTYLLTGENIEAAKNTMNAQYDGTLHTFLLEGVNKDLVGWLDYSNYDNADTSRADYALTSKHYPTTTKANGNFYTVGEIYGNTFLGSAALKATQVDKNNLLAISGKYVGTYTIQIALIDTDNVRWKGTTSTNTTPVLYHISVNKKSHEAPKIASGYSALYEYTGDYITFKFENILNGVNSDGIKTEQFEFYEFNNYAGFATNNPKLEEVSWKDGILELRAKEVGTYTFTVRLANPETVMWSNSTEQSIKFSVRIERRTLTADFSYESSDQSINPSLAAGGNSWPSSAPVDIIVNVRNVVALKERVKDSDGNYIRDDLGQFVYENVPDDNIGLRFYYYMAGATDVIYDDLELKDQGKVYDSAKGTFTLWFKYSLPTGLPKNNYYPCILHTAANDNYSLSLTRGLFRVTADNAAFDPTSLYWRWAIDDGDFVAETSLGYDSSNRFPLPYLIDGRSYRFDVYLKDDAMGENTTVENALIALDVKLSGYSGTTVVKNAGNYWVSVKIVVADSSKYYFPDTTFTFYYTITPAKYDISVLTWDYKGDDAFTYGGGSKSVRLVSSLTNGVLPSGLSIRTYNVTGYSNNVQTYAGTYSTTVTFANSNPNYVTPVLNNKDTYAEPGEDREEFVWVCTWKINKQKLNVSWKTSRTSGTNGTSTIQPVLANYTGYVNYTYWKQNADGSFTAVDKIQHTPNITETFRVQASLKVTSYASSYHRNYELVFPADDPEQTNPLIFTLGENECNIFVHVEIEETELKGSSEAEESGVTEFAYNGSAKTATVFIDFDGSGGLIGVNNIRITYYSSTNLNKPISAPTTVGSYRVTLTLTFSDSDSSGTDLAEYTLVEPYYDFKIVKGTFDPENIYWQYTHSDTTGTVRAIYDAEQSKWINTETEEAIENFYYDGAAHNVTLVTKDTKFLKITNKNYTNINAGDNYTTTASLSFDGTQWNTPDIALTFNWKIAQAILDFSLVKWSKEDDFVYSVVRGTPVTYSVELLNLPEYLQDKVTYTTSYNGGAEAKGNSGSQAGTYVTKYTIEEVTNPNYVLGSMPLFVANPYEWTIDTKAISVPEDMGKWDTFDGVYHNLLSLIELDEDWDLYFTITVTYSSNGTSWSNFSGTSASKYSAYNAGTYRLTLALNSGLNTATATNVAWLILNGNEDGSNKLETTNQTVDISVAKEKLTVSGWTENYESSTVKLANGVSSSKFVGYDFTNSRGQKVSMNTILASAGGETFNVIPYIKSAYSINVELSYADDSLRSYTFVTMTFDEQNGKYIGNKPFIESYTVDGKTIPFDKSEIDKGVVSVKYSGSEVKFNISNWETYYSQYLDVYEDSDSLTQSTAGTYTITLLLKKNRTEPLSWGDGTLRADRSAVVLTFKIEYLTLTIPSIKNSFTYTGKNIEVLQASYDGDALAALQAEYANYVTITGYSATQIGNYQLRLSIKDQYLNTVRWSNGSEDTIKINWSILPIYLVKPVRDNTLLALLIYDGEEHSVYEVLRGYSEENMSEDLKWLMQNVRLAVDGSRSINAGDFTAVFSLPNSNYAWSDKTTADVSIAWSIQKKRIELNSVTWDYTRPFTYTIEDGTVKSFSVSLTGLPAELAESVQYLTGGKFGNSASDVGKYTTEFVFNESAIDSSNYTIVSSITINRTIEWEIKTREFVMPGEEVTKIFNGKAIDLLASCNFAEGWENYFDVEVLYRPEGTDTHYDEYEGYENSLYLGYQIGDYYITIKFKAGMNTAATQETEAVYRAVWLLDQPDEDGNEWSVETQYVNVKLNKLVISVTGWNEDKQFSTVKFNTQSGAEIKTLEDLGDMVEHIIYDGTDNSVVPVQGVKDGGNYYITFNVKSDYEFAISVQYVNDDGTPNEGLARYIFSLANFTDGQKVIWLPKPVIVYKGNVDGNTATSRKFTNEEQTFEIDYSKYDITPSKQLELIQLYNLPSNYFRELARPFTENPSFITVVSGSFTQRLAGDYSVVVRLITGFNLSWYDPAVYDVNSNGELTNQYGAVVQNPVVNRLAETITFKITVRDVNRIDIDKYAERISNDFVYDGSLQDALKDNGVYDELKALYGELIKISGYQQTEAGNHVIKIELAEPSSSRWVWVETGEELDKSNYGFVWVEDNGTVKLKYVLMDEEGNPVIGEDGGYVEYNNGKYDIDDKYVEDTKYKIEYVAIADANGLLVRDEYNAYMVVDNTLKPVSKYLQDGNGNYIKDANGDYVVREYIVNASGYAVLYQFVNGEYIEETGEINGYSGYYAARYVYDEKGNKVENVEYKKEYIDYETVNNVEYMIDASGNIYKYVTDDAGNKTAQLVSAFDGELKFGDDGEIVRYGRVDGEYVEDPNGDYIAKKVVDVTAYKTKYIPVFSGEVIEDSNGGYVLLYVVLGDDGSYSLKSLVLGDDGAPVTDENGVVVLEPVITNDEVFNGFVIQNGTYYRTENVSVYAGESLTPALSGKLFVKKAEDNSGNYVLYRVTSTTNGFELKEVTDTDFVLKDGPYYNLREIPIYKNETFSRGDLGKLYVVNQNGEYILKVVAEGKNAAEPTLADYTDKDFAFSVISGTYYRRDEVAVYDNHDLTAEDLNKYYAVIGESGDFEIRRVLANASSGEIQYVLEPVTANMVVDGMTVYMFVKDTNGIYVQDENGDFISKFILSDDGASVKVYIQTDNGSYAKNSSGDFVSKYNVTQSGDTVNVSVYVQDNAGNYVKDSSGKYVSKYGISEDGKSVLIYDLDESGNKVVDEENTTYKYDHVFVFVSEHFVTDENGNVIRYTLTDGKYVEDEEGEYIAKYLLDSKGNRLKDVEYKKDENGNFIVDTENTTVTMRNEKYDNELTFTIDWTISPNGSIVAPTLKDVTITYNGKEINIEDYLDGFYGNFMEVTVGGKYTDAGTYTAVISFKEEVSKNYGWKDADLGAVSIEWTIVPAVIDLSEVTWDYTAPFTYTRENGRAVVYSVSLTNLPEAVQGKVLYTTNGLEGSHSGTDAGKYTTTFTFAVKEGNIELKYIPDSIKTLVWKIQRRTLPVPVVNNANWTVFDDNEHDLLEIFGLKDCYDELKDYCDITVKYSSTFAVPLIYEGPDGNGDIFTAFGSGLYQISIKIADGININPKNPCVVWATTAATKPVDPAPTPDNPGEDGNEGEDNDNNEGNEGEGSDNNGGSESGNGDVTEEPTPETAASFNVRVPQPAATYDGEEEGEDPDNPGDGGDEGEDPDNPGDGGDEGEDPDNPGDGGDEGEDPDNPGDGGDEGEDPDNPGDGGDEGEDPDNPPAPASFEVKFDVQGIGEAPENQSVEPDGLAVKPEDPQAEGYKFEGWYKEAECENLFDFGEGITESITLYAKWTDLSIDPDDPNQGGIATPDPDDNDDFDIDDLELINRVDRLVVEILQWEGSFPYNTVSLAVPAYSKYIEYKLTDADNKVIQRGDVSSDGGEMYFLHVKPLDKYAPYITLKFAEGVKEKIDYITPFPDGEEPTYVEKPEIKRATYFYTGEKITFSIEDAVPYWYDETLNYQEYLRIISAVSDEMTQTEVGKYIIRIGFKAGLNYAWVKEEGSTAIDRSVIEVAFEILPQTFKMDKVLEPVPYTGKRINILSIILEKYGNYVTAVTSPTETTVGTYQIKLAIDSRYTSSITWDESMEPDEDGNVTIEWSISKAKLSGKWNDAEGILTLESPSYTGEYVDVVFEYRDTDGNKVNHDELDPNLTYYIVAVLLDTDNFDPDDGLFGEPHTRLPISPYTIPLDIPSFTLAEQEYTGAPIQFTIKDWDGYSSYIEIDKGISYLTQTRIGTYTITFKAKGEYIIYWMSDGAVTQEEQTLTFKIVPKTIVLPSADDLKVAYTGEVIDIIDLLDATLVANCEISGSTGTLVGDEYVLRIKLKAENEGNFVWPEGTVFDEDGVTVIVSWSITKAYITGTWRADGRLDLSSNSYKGSFANIISYEYYNSSDEKISYGDLEVGVAYKAVVVLLDTDNFEFSDVETEKWFTLENELIWLDTPSFAVQSASYTGKEITFSFINWEENYKDYVIIVTAESDSLTQTKVGDYKVVLRVTAMGVGWKENANVTEIHVPFSITKAVIKGSWNIDGSMTLTSSYTGSYDNIVEYTYRDENNNIVNRADLVKGKTYTAYISLTETGEESFVFVEGLETEKQFVYYGGGSGLPTWLIILLCVVGFLVLLIIIILIIIIILLRRKQPEPTVKNIYNNYDGGGYGDDGDEEDDLIVMGGNIGGDFGGGDFGGGDFGGGDFGGGDFGGGDFGGGDFGGGDFGGGDFGGGDFGGGDFGGGDYGL